MTKDEFEMFSAQLPRSYQERFARMGTFEKLSAGKNVILYEDFELALDIFAEMQANDCDIDFQVVPTKQKRKNNPSMAFRKKMTTYFTQRQTSYLAEFIAKEMQEREHNVNNLSLLHRESSMLGPKLSMGPKLSLKAGYSGFSGHQSKYSVHHFNSHSHKISIGGGGNRYSALSRRSQMPSIGNLRLDASHLDEDDDREYDDDLLTYQNQIVITRRTTPGHRFNDYGLNNVNTPRKPPHINIVAGI